MRRQLFPPFVVAYTPSSRRCHAFFESAQEDDRGPWVRTGSALPLGVEKPSTIPVKVPMTTRPRTMVGAWTAIPPSDAENTFAPFAAL